MKELIFDLSFSQMKKYLKPIRMFSFISIILMGKAHIETKFCSCDHAIPLSFQILKHRWQLAFTYSYPLNAKTTTFGGKGTAVKRETSTVVNHMTNILEHFEDRLGKKTVLTE